MQKYLKPQSAAVRPREAEAENAPPTAVRQRTDAATMGPPPPKPPPPRPAPPAQQPSPSPAASTFAPAPTSAPVDAPSDASLPPLAAPWMIPSPPRASAANGADEAADDDEFADDETDETPPDQVDSQDDAGMMSCSQLSQAQPFDEDHKCSICLNLLHEPVSTPCNHHFCRTCFYPAVSATGPRDIRACPNCRNPIPLDKCDPPVEHALWRTLQEQYPQRVARRREAEARAAARAVRTDMPGGGTAGQSSDAPGAPPLQLERDRLREEMRTHRAVLEAVHADYFVRLEAELARPRSEVWRCRCAPRFVCVRRQVAAAGANHGRLYIGCPMHNRQGSGGCRYFEWLA